jgi:hypothetical protein
MTGKPAARIIIAGMVVLSLISHSASEPFDEKYGRMIPDDTVRASLTEALKKIHLQRCKQIEACAPATKKDFDEPPITIEDGRAAMVFGIKSALAQWCGLDWKRVLLPMIAFGRTQKKMGDRQLMLMTLMHGDFQSRQLVLYTKSGTCPATLRAQLDTQLPKIN